MENIQKARRERHNSKILKALKKYMDLEIIMNTYQDLIPAKLYSAISKAIEPNMDNYAAMVAVDTMELIIRYIL
jgi:hypothetical protein